MGTEFGRALVLGPGGVVGTAWLTGLAAGLRRAGVDLAAADLIVGTSAGAIVGAMLATGEDLDRFAELPPVEGAGYPSPEAVMAEVFGVLSDTGLEPAAARRRVGEIALAADLPPEEAHVGRMRELITAREWPDRPLLVTAVDVGTGERVVWDRDGAAPLVDAVASSTAFPGGVRPILINGRRYLDGGLADGANSDLADGAAVTVIVEPLAHLFSPGTPAPDTASLVRIVPDQASLDAFGPDLVDRSVWNPVYANGVRQAADVAGRIAAVWTPKPRPGPVRMMRR